MNWFIPILLAFFAIIFFFRFAKFVLILVIIILLSLFLLLWTIMLTDKETEKFIKEIKSKKIKLIEAPTEIRKNKKLINKVNFQRRS